MISKTVRKYYTKNADKIGIQYDTSDRTDNWWFVDDAIHNIVNNNGEVLELGAGQGHFASKLACEYNFHVVASEPVAAMIERGRTKFPDPRIDWVQAAMPNLGTQIRSQKFSFLAAFGSWQYLADREQRIRSLNILGGILEEGGRFVTIHPYPPSRSLQQGVSHQMMMAEVKETGWIIEKHEVFPYAALVNKEAANDTGLLAYELSFDSFAN